MPDNDKHAVLEAVTVLTAKLERLEEDTLRQHQEKMQKLADVEAQVKHTNGRVKELEMENERKKAVEAYILAHPVATTVAVETGHWDWKAVLAIILTLSTVAAGIVGVAAK